MLEHQPRRDRSPARRARLTSWIDTMLSPPSSKKLSSIPTRSSPSTSANSEHSTASCGVRGARCDRDPNPAPAQAAPGGRACRSASAAAAPAPPAQTAPCSPASAADSAARSRRHVRRRPGRRHHIADQPPLAARAIRPRDHRGPRHPRLPQQHRLDLARLDPEPAQLHLRVGAPQELQHPIAAATAPGPRSGTSARRPHHAGRRQTAPPSDPHGSDSPAQAQPPRCTAHPQHPHGTGSRPASRT